MGEEADENEDEEETQDAAIVEPYLKAYMDRTS